MTFHGGIELFIQKLLSVLQTEPTRDLSSRVGWNRIVFWKTGSSSLCLQKYLAVQWWSPAVTWVWGMSLCVRAGSDTSGRWGAPQTPPGQTRTIVQSTWHRAPSPSHSSQTVSFAWAQSYWKCHWQVLSVNRKERNNPNNTYEKKHKQLYNLF